MADAGGFWGLLPSLAKLAGSMFGEKTRSQNLRWKETGRLNKKVNINPQTPHRRIYMQKKKREDEQNCFTQSYTKVLF